MELPTSSTRLREEPREGTACHVSSQNCLQFDLVTLQPEQIETEHMASSTAETGIHDAITKTDDANAKLDDANTGTADISAGTDDDVYAAPEGGWGWMVTLAGFAVAFIADGIVSSFGLMIPELMSTFGVGMSLSSLPPAILGAIYLLCGPVTGYLVNRWGCRLVGFCGGLLTALGVCVSAYAANIYLFLLGFGLMAGLGVGLIYLPSITMVNMYFHKKRGIVAGIITSGSGFGLLALAPLTEVLIEQYGWRGCYLVMAAITLNFCVCASLMRPLHRPPPSSPHSSQTLEGVEVEGEDSWSLVSVQEMVDTVEGHRPDLITLTDGKGKRADHLKTCGDEDSHGVDSDFKLQLVENGHMSHLQDRAGQEERSELRHLVRRTHHSSLLSSVRNLFSGPQGRNGSHVPCSADISLQRSRSQGHLESRRHHAFNIRLPVNVLSTWLACQVPPSLSRHTLPSHQSSDSMAGQSRGCEQQRGMDGCPLVTPSRTFQENQMIWGQSLPSVAHSEDLWKQIALKVAPAPPQQACKISAEELRAEPASRYTLVSGRATICTEEPSSAEPEKQKAAGFWLGKEGKVMSTFLAGAFFIQLVCGVPPLLVPSFALHHGISNQHVASIIAIYGLLNTAGRLLAGVLVYWGARSLHVYNVSTLLSAVACFILPFCSSFPAIAVCLGLHAFFIGAFPPLQPVILVEYLGLERLTSSFGTMCLVKAFASAGGAPLAGLLFTVTGAYTVPLALCGAILIMAAIFSQLMDCWPRYLTHLRDS